MSRTRCSACRSSALGANARISCSLSDEGTNGVLPSPFGFSASKDGFEACPGAVCPRRGGRRDATAFARQRNTIAHGLDPVAMAATSNRARRLGNTTRTNVDEGCGCVNIPAYNLHSTYQYFFFDAGGERGAGTASSRRTSPRPTKSALRHLLRVRRRHRL